MNSICFRLSVTVILLSTASKRQFRYVVILPINIDQKCLGLLLEALDKGQQAQESSELNQQGVELFQHFERFGDVTALEIAIEMLRKAVAYTPVNSPDRPGRLNSLGNSHASRFGRFGEVRDIEWAI